MKIKLDYDQKKNKGRILIDNNTVKDRLYHAFSVVNEGKKFVKGPSKHWIKNRIYFITPSGYFDFGLTEHIIQWIKDYVCDVSIEFEISDSFKQRFNFENENNIKVVNNLKLTLRSYQEKSVKTALKYKFGTFVLRNSELVRL